MVNTGPDTPELSSKSTSEVEHYVIKLLTQNRKLTTSEIVAQAELDGVSCPDEPVRFLNRLRLQGVIQGQLSLEHKGWLWWV
jgi:hypothetical protein